MIGSFVLFYSILLTLVLQAMFGSGCPWAALGFERQGGFLRAVDGIAVKLWRRDVNDDYKILPLSAWTPSVAAPGEEGRRRSRRGEESESAEEREREREGALGNADDFFDVSKKLEIPAGARVGDDSDDGADEDEDDDELFLDSNDRREVEADFDDEEGGRDGYDDEEGVGARKLGKRQREAAKRRRGCPPPSYPHPKRRPPPS